MKAVLLTPPNERKQRTLLGHLWGVEGMKTLPRERWRCKMPILYVTWVALQFYGPYNNRLPGPLPLLFVR